MISTHVKRRQVRAEGSYAHILAIMRRIAAITSRDPTTTSFPSDLVTLFPPGSGHSSGRKRLCSFLLITLRPIGYREVLREGTFRPPPRNMALGSLAVLFGGNRPARFPFC